MARPRESGRLVSVVSCFSLTTTRSYDIPAFPIHLELRRQAHSLPRSPPIIKSSFYSSP